MEGFIEILLANPFFILIIIGILMSLFRDKPTVEEAEDSQTPRPVSTSQNRTNQSTPLEEEREKPAPITAEDQSIEERRAAQMDRLRDQLSAYENEDVDELERKPMKDATQANMHVQRERQFKKLKRQMKKNVTKKGLLNGIIMAEVLGPPRAIKPYRSVIQERQK